MLQYLPELIKGLYINLILTITSVIISFILALFSSIILIMRVTIFSWIVRIYIIFFTGTPLLVQIFLIYYGPGQFPSLQKYYILWSLLSDPRFCALIALSLNSTAYTAQIFYIAICTIPTAQWQSCNALGMNKKDTLAILLPYAFNRALSSYSNEVIQVFKSTSLSYTITLMEIMGQCQLIYGRTYDAIVFFETGILYLLVSSLIVILIRLLERKLLYFEQRK